MASQWDISVLKWEGERKKRDFKRQMLPFRIVFLMSLLTSTLLTIRMSVLTTVEHPITFHQKFFQIILEGVFKDVTVSIGSLTP